ncbi:MAG TPA: tripartite tricarboxylate transporter substrate binding protein [Beijerinckiaceae bacterium]
MFRAFALAAALTTSSACLAEEVWPTQQVRLIVPYAAGGTTDYLGRLAAEHISRVTGQSVIVENRTGAGGNIGADIVAKSAPDGRTIAMVTNGVLTVNQFIYRKMPFDPNKDLVTAAILGEAPQVVVTPKSFPADTMKDFIAYAKANPGGINYGTAGVGSSNHLSALQLERIAGIKLTHVPYRGAAPAVTDLTTAHIQMMSVGVAPVISLVEAGQLKLIAATTKERMPQLPDLPTATEAGAPGYESTTWFGIIAPAATPEPILRRINEHMRTLLDRPDVQKVFRDQYLVAWRMNLAETRKHVIDETAMWGKLIREAGIKLD